MIYANVAGIVVSDFSLDELHSFCAGLGLGKDAFANHPTHPHYSLKRYSAAKDAMIADPILIKDAFEKGAKFVNWRRLAKASKDWRDHHVPVGLERSIPIYRLSGFLGEVL